MAVFTYKHVCKIYKTYKSYRSYKTYVVHRLADLCTQLSTTPHFNNLMYHILNFWNHKSNKRPFIHNVEKQKNLSQTMNKGRFIRIIVWTVRESNSHLPDANRVLYH